MRKHRCGGFFVLGTNWGQKLLGVPKIHSDLRVDKKEKPLIYKGFEDWRGLNKSYFSDSGSSGGNTVEVQVLSTA